MSFSHKKGYYQARFVELLTTKSLTTSITTPTNQKRLPGRVVIIINAKRQGPVGFFEEIREVRSSGLEHERQARKLRISV